MIQVSITDNGFTIQGHSGYEEAGKDIVCAAVSSCANMVLCGLEDTLKIACKVQAEPEKPLLTLELPKGISDEQKKGARILLNAFQNQMKSVHEEYPEYLKVF